MLARILLLLAILCTACSESQDAPSKLTEFSGTAMTMAYRILVGQPISEGDAKDIETIVRSTFKEVDATYNIWNPESELSAINRQPGGEWTPLSPELEHLLHVTDRLVVLTDGYFDPTIMAAYQLWTKKLKSQTIPTQEDIDSLRKTVGWDKVKISEGRIKKSCAEVMIDLGGIAKGFCVDLLAERLIERGFTNCYVEWGGEIRTNGRHPEQRPWNVYISNLTDIAPEHALAVIPLGDESLATSGDYLQQWSFAVENGETCTYTHIINPKTLVPLKVTQENICSATVKAKSCTEADALATAAMLFPSVNEAKVWANEIQADKPEIQFWFATRNSKRVFDK